MRSVVLVLGLVSAFARAEPRPLPTCAEATAELAGEVAPLPDATKLPPLRATDRRAILVAVKGFLPAMHGPSTAARATKALDRLIADGARFELHQYAALPTGAIDAERIAIVSFTLDDVPDIDRGPYLVLAIRRGGAWHAAMNVWFDPDARITGTAKKALVFEHAVRDQRQLWLVSVTKPRPGRPDAVVGSRRCRGT